MCIVTLYALFVWCEMWLLGFSKVSMEMSDQLYDWSDMSPETNKVHAYVGENISHGKV